MSAVLFSAGLAACSGDRADREERASVSDMSDGAGEVNLDVWLETMEVGSREIYGARINVLDALGLKPGDRIADIGAGTGLYSLLFAEAVGEDGVVYAVDIEPRFLKLINQRADDLDLDSVVSVLGRVDSITLPPQSVDYVFISDTYNYFENPQAIMKTIYEALRPGGVLYVLEFKLIRVDGGKPPSHVRVGKEAAAREIETVGFVFDGDVPAAGLEETYLIKFSRP